MLLKTPYSPEVLTRERARRLTCVTALAWGLPPPPLRGGGRRVARRAATKPSLVLALSLASF